MDAEGRRAIRDECVIYYSPEDGCWLAHGLHTDQIGTGECIVEALTDFLRALDELSDLAAAEPDVQAWREAPPEVLRKATEAEPLPGELYEIAHKIVHGQWPDIEVDAKPRRQRSYRTELVPAAS